MENTGTLVIRVLGETKGNKLSPSNYDIKEIVSLLANIEDILYPNQKNRPLITYELGEGSVLNKFKTTIQAVISSTAIFASVQEAQSTEHLEPQTAKAIEVIQKVAYQKNYTFEISSSESDSVILEINPQTKFVITKDYFVETELYVYGELTDAGGKTKPNLHLDTLEYGALTIQVSKDVIKELDGNPLYRNFGARIKTKQHASTGEIDKSSIVFLELVQYDSNYDEDYLKSCIKNATPKWQGFDSDKWLDEMRGGYDA
ncbi:hypothetical protein [Flavobacterium hibernum]|uniref:Uncharacterized protein n=1 Tax=Flavobacterium hibernum TaxID=37752 RepID=A0A0D0ERY4_9FLAO|nr:hypothetical protein [Flavobacterium hibernum]KIO50953.1 hypothetical protein IW18_20420 [Flavobacterium hibernum]OXA85195.1 hypothetical protein B0A73_17760 [Flavobacterium hibernum]